MKELIQIQRNLKAPKGQYNQHGKYKYRSCEDILEALKPLLFEYECTLIISDEIKQIGNRYYVEATATLTNSEGKRVAVTALAREEEERKGMAQAQLTGACSSYARKYALNGLFAIDDTKDADTMDNTKEEAKPTPKQTPKFTLEEALILADGAQTIEEITDLWGKCKEYQRVQQFKDLITQKGKEFKKVKIEYL